MAASRDMSRDKARRVTRCDRIGRIVLVDRIAPDASPVPGGLAMAPTPEGFLRGRARIARAGVLVYGDGARTWGEYRSVETLRKAAPSFHLALLTNDHPAEFVEAANARDLFVGVLSDPSVVRGDDGVDYLEADITIADADAIAIVRAGKRELSIGFTATILERAGVFGGDSFEFEQVDLLGNHTAIVEEGRAGPMCKIPIGDALRDELAAWHRAPTSTLTQRNDRTMDPVTIELAGVAYQIDPAVAAHIAGLEQQLAAMQQGAVEAAAAATPPAPAVAPPAPAPVPAPAPAAVGDAAALRGERDAALARAAALEASIPRRVSDRVALILAAGSVLDEVETDHSDAQIRADVAIAMLPSLEPQIRESLAAANKGDAAAAAYLAGVFDVAIKMAEGDGGDSRELADEVDALRRRDAANSGSLLDAVVAAERHHHTRRTAAK